MSRYTVTSLMGTQWPQTEQQLPAQPLMTVPTTGIYGQFQQTQQYPPQQAMAASSDTVYYYQQLQV